MIICSFSSGFGAPNQRPKEFLRTSWAVGGGHSCLGAGFGPLFTVCFAIHKPEKNALLVKKTTMDLFRKSKKKQSGLVQSLTDQLDQMAIQESSEHAEEEEAAAQQQRQQQQRHYLPSQ